MFVLTPEVTNCVSASRTRQNEVLRREDEDETLAASEKPLAEPEHHFFVTDVPGPFQQVAERFLGRPIRNLERV